MLPPPESIIPSPVMSMASNRPYAIRSMRSVLPPGASKNTTLQKYIQLCTQQDNLRHRLSSTNTSTSPLSPSSPSDSFPASPTRSRQGSVSPTNYNYNDRTSAYISTSTPTPPHPGMPSTAESSNARGSDEERLCDVNHQIKATLTDLLNSESVRGDEKFRHWVQDRLIDAEMELRRQKRRSRRRSSADKDGVVNTIAESFRAGPSGFAMDGEGLWRLGTTV